MLRNAAMIAAAEGTRQEARTIVRERSVSPQQRRKLGWPDLLGKAEKAAASSAIDAAAAALKEPRAPQTTENVNSSHGVLSAGAEPADVTSDGNNSKSNSTQLQTNRDTNWEQVAVSLDSLTAALAVIPMDAGNAQYFGRDSSAAEMLPTTKEIVQLTQLASPEVRIEPLAAAFVARENGRVRAPPKRNSPLWKRRAARGAPKHESSTEQISACDATHSTQDSTNSTQGSMHSAQGSTRSAQGSTHSAQGSLGLHGVSEDSVAWTDVLNLIQTFEAASSSTAQSPCSTAQSPCQSPCTVSLPSKAEPKASASKRRSPTRAATFNGLREQRAVRQKAPLRDSEDVGLGWTEVLGAMHTFELEKSTPPRVHRHDSNKEIDTRKGGTSPSASPVNINRVLETRSHKEITREHVLDPNRKKFRPRKIRSRLAQTSIDTTKGERAAALIAEISAARESSQGRGASEHRPLERSQSPSKVWLSPPDVDSLVGMSSKDRATAITTLRASSSGVASRVLKMMDYDGHLCK